MKLRLDRAVAAAAIRSALPTTRSVQALSFAMEGMLRAKAWFGQTPRTCKVALGRTARSDDHSAMKRQLRCFGLLLCGLILVANGCRRGPKPLAIRAAAAARPSALGSVVIANLDRTFDRAEAIAKSSSLPFDKTSQKKTLLDATKIPQALLSALRADAPVAAVAFAPKEKGKDPELAMAIMGKSPEALRAAVAGLGKPLAARQDAVQFKVGDHGDHGDHADDDRWFLLRGGSLLVATSLETLIGGAALALE